MQAYVASMAVRPETQGSLKCRPAAWKASEGQLQKRPCAKVSLGHECLGMWSWSCCSSPCFLLWSCPHACTLHGLAVLRSSGVTCQTVRPTTTGQQGVHESDMETPKEKGTHFLLQRFLKPTTSQKQNSAPGTKTRATHTPKCPSQSLACPPRANKHEVQRPNSQRCRQTRSADSQPKH